MEDSEPSSLKKSIASDDSPVNITIISGDSSPLLQAVPVENRADIEAELRSSLGGVRTRRLINSGRVVIVDSQEEMQRIIDGVTGDAQFSKTVDLGVKDSDHIIVGDTPRVLVALGAKQLKLMVSGKVLNKVTRGKHGGSLTISGLLQVQAGIYDPEAVFSGSEPGSMVILTEVVDEDGGKVIVPVHLNGKSGRNEVNWIKSIYGKDEIGKWITANLKAGNLLYVNKRKAADSDMTRWLDLHPPDNSRASVRGQKSIGYGDKILTEEDIVNAGKEPSVKYSQDGTIQGAYVNGTAYLVRDGIAKDQAFPVLLHELGEHAGQLGFNTDAEYQAILKSLERRKDAKGATGDAIRAAMARVPASTKPEHYWSEVAAYLIENNANEKLSIFDLIKSFFKKLLVKAGLSSPDTLSHKDLVAFARAAVNASSGGNAVQSAMLSVREQAAQFKAVDVNSENFKAWFGDWELAASMKAASEFIDKVAAGKRPSNISIGAVSGKAAGRIKQLTGVNTKGREFELIADDIAHALKGHGNKSVETARGQIPITLEDLKILPIVLRDPTSINPGTAQGGRQSVRFEKKINGTLVIVEIVPSSGGSVQFKTAWKRPSETADALPPSHTSKTDLSPPHSYNRTIQRLIERSKSSVVVDEKGQPLRVYHGTKLNFDKFDVSGDGAEEIGAFFTTHPEAANMYAVDSSKNSDGRVYQVFLAIKNPYEVSYQQWLNADGLSPMEAKQEGYDGYIVRGMNRGGDQADTYIAFSPAQIKSAISNTGAFSPNDPRVQYSRDILFKPVDPNSPALKRFLGNSQVTTPVHHGSPTEFWTFDKNQQGTNTNQSRTGLVFFFATDRTEGQGYAGPGGANRSFYVKVEKSFV